ncbi:MAG TPA: diphosphate--fructose-6-phosphate 1-phosphotransferase [Candidatus Polarisedimenticolaceae bacterium]|nr:diphosphate--fructose-6-phosphate 1-phosphotransferase [Candidatus Polarisedimenticolaceae bacterium]
MQRAVSALERARLAYRPRLPPILRSGLDRLAVEEAGATTATRDADLIRARFPRTFGRPIVRLGSGRSPMPSASMTVGVVLSGGQAPGGHNVITGLFDALRSMHADSRLLGFLGGPRGVVEGNQRELTEPLLAPFRNTGGFDLIGGGRDKIETTEQFAACRATCLGLGLDGLVIVGGDDSNTNAAMLAEYFVEHDVRTAVVGVPKTIDGDMRGNGIETSFGFDTATKTYSELIGNICRDAASAGKYWHFVKLMGRNASHVALECALSTRVNVALIGEEVERDATTLEQIVERIAQVIRARAATGRGYGVCIVPEGLIEFIPEMRALIAELNRLLADPSAAGPVDRRETIVAASLGNGGRRAFASLPEAIRHQLLFERDAHGNVQVSLIETERLLVEKVRERLGGLRAQQHFFGYEGRSAAPSNFDADYTYALGHVAAALIALGRTGYVCAVQDLHLPPDRWRAAGIPLTSLMQIEQRRGRATPVIGKALVDLGGAPFGELAAERERWSIEDAYLYPGAIQYFGPDEICNRPTRTLELEAGARR